MAFCEPGGVVDSSVYDAGVVSRLVLGDDGLLLDDDYFLVGMFLGNPHRGSQSDYAAANDGDVVVSGVHFISSVGVVCGEFPVSGLAETNCITAARI